MNSTENHECPLLASQPADFIAAQCVAGVNSNSNNVAGPNACDIQLLQGFINDYRIAEAGGCRSGEHIEPPRRDDSDAERFVTRIDEINSQCTSLGRGTSGSCCCHQFEARHPHSEAQPILLHVLSPLK